LAPPSESNILSLWFLNYNQQDATIFDYVFLKDSTCIGRFFRPSSGAYNCTLSSRNCRPILLVAEQLHLIHDTSLQQYWSTVLEMMGGGTDRNM